MKTVYVRRKNRTPIAVFVGGFDENGMFIGWSKCNEKYDVFNKKRGRKIAMVRSQNCATEYNIATCPESLKEKFIQFVDNLQPKN